MTKTLLYEKRKTKSVKMSIFTQNVKKMVENGVFYPKIDKKLVVLFFTLCYFSSAKIKINDKKASL